MATFDHEGHERVAVLTFDDTICRLVMLPRSDVVFFDADLSLPECIQVVRHTKHTRYPVCERSLDHVLGVVHIKDLVGADPDTALRSLMRPPHYVPESMPISRLLRHFQAIRQHLAMVVDEHGTTVGIVTLENVLEQIVGPVDDEFDEQIPGIVPQDHGVFLVRGTTQVGDVNREIGLDLDCGEADTLSGVVVARLGRVPAQGDVVELRPGIRAEVVEVRGARAELIRVVQQGAAGSGS